MSRNRKMSDQMESPMPQDEVSPKESSKSATRGFGFLPSPRDARDQHFSARIGASSDVFEPAPVASNRDLILDVLDQGAGNSCIANMGGQQFRAQLKQQGLPDLPLLSRRFSYYMLRALEGQQHEDRGGFVRNFYRSVNKFGYCAERTEPYEVAALQDAPSERAYMEAYANRVQLGYYRIDVAGMDGLQGSALTTAQYQRKVLIQKALMARHTVGFGTAVDIDTFPSVRGSAVVDPPTWSANVAGHAMLAIGYNASGVEVVNSWGREWGQDGFATLSWDYILDPRTNDMWTVEVLAAPKFYTGNP